MTCPRWGRPGALAVLVLALSGCYTWRPYEFRAMPDAGRPLPHRLQATGQNGARIVLTAPFVRSDTLFGQVDGDTVAVPFSRIATLERDRLSIERTLGLALVPAAALGLGYLIVCGNRGCESHY